jgi:hypothetical protein
MTQIQCGHGVFQIANPATSVASLLHCTRLGIALFVDIVGRFPHTIECSSTTTQRYALKGDGPLVLCSGDLKFFMRDRE